MKKVTPKMKAMKQAIKDMIASDVQTQVLKLDDMFRLSHQDLEDTYYNVSR